MNNLTERSSSLAAAWTALTPQNFANKKNLFANKKNLASKTSLGTLYYSSMMLFPDRHVRHADIRHPHGEPFFRCADQRVRGLTQSRALSMSPFA